MQKASKTQHCENPTKQLSWRWMPVIVVLITVSHLLIEFSRQRHAAITIETTLESMNIERELFLFSKSDEECPKILMKYPEPFISSSKKKTIDLSGPVYATYNWTRPMTKDLIDVQRNRSGESRVPGNTRVIFKVKDSVLYVDASNTMFKTIYPDGVESIFNSTSNLRFNAFIELLLVTLHLYNIPDLDFTVELSDGARPTNPPHPVLSYSISGLTVDAGFTIPSYGTFRRSLGQTQLLLLKECLKVKHSRNMRIKKAVWRGTTTGTHMNSADDALKNLRVNLSYNCAKRPDLFDVGLVEYLQIDKNDTKLVERLTELAPRKERMPMSGFNDYAVVLDVDGNGWSDRLPVLLRGDAVVLKQEYKQHLDYLTEIAKRSDAITFFNYDQSDLETQASMLLHEYNEDREKWEARIEKMTDFAKEYVSHDGVIRAMAYALTNYASFQDWEVEEQEGYVVIPKTLCCKGNSALPRELIKEVQSS